VTPVVDEKSVSANRSSSGTHADRSDPPWHGAPEKIARFVIIGAIGSAIGPN
jgi:hypothetical protein